MKRFFYGLVALVLITAPQLLQAATLTNPLGTTNIRAVIGRIIQAILGVTGSIALLMFIWGGFLWLTSAGNDTRIKKGKDTLVWSSIGLTVMVAAYALVQTIVVALETGTVQ
ncbi:MAG: hypothetical protein P8J32_03090 [bacterium]|jgi:hypothetical protein|nr:hypothetical protein [bacterium]